MNLVAFWRDQVNIWNQEQKCDLCWEFGAPLIESAANIQKPEDGKECCVKVLFLQDKQPAFTTNRTYNNTTGLIQNITCTQSFQLLVLLPISIDKNNFNEIPGHPTAESKWDSVLFKLQQCLMCDAELDFCEILGTQYRITQWSGSQVLNYSDNNYTGYRINVQFQMIR